ncbi:MAG: hypothetical protein QOG71_3727 [Pyrinomonadaceae bacterium]|nr:hypothetical protein [Pyrinomonadaceae bacterium]
MVLTGHLDDQPLPDLIRTLRAQRKSGRLQVEYADSPGAFFFEDGQLVDAQLGNLRGLEALYAALALDGASFNFNPLVRPPERSIDRQQQKFINDLVATPRRENLPEVRVAGGAFPATTAATGAALAASTQPAPLQLAPVPAELLAPLEQRLTAVEAAINASSRRFSRERLVYAVVISFLVGLCVVTALQALLSLRRTPLNAPATDATISSQQLDAATGTTATAAGGEATRGTSDAASKKGGAGVAPVERGNVATNNDGRGNVVANNDGRESIVAAAATSQAAGATKKVKPAVTTKQAQSLKLAPQATKEIGKKAGASSSEGGYVIHVLLDVKRGEVIGARVLNPRPGASAYDSQAIKIARARRYPSTFSGSDTVMLRVRF